MTTRFPDELLNNVEAFLGTFVAYPSEATRIAHTLWCAHAHAMEAWDTTPRIAFLSPEPGSGKTRALEITELLVPNPVMAVNVSASYLFRKVGSDEGLPTILFDEIDTVFGPKARENEEVRGLLNAGYRQGAVAGRCVVQGKKVETEELAAYCAVALAGLGHLPDSILSRSVIVRMKRRSPNERVQPFRRRLYQEQGEALRADLADWLGETAEELRERFPEMPEGIEDRDADIWEPLLAIADAAGGDWPTRARVAAVALVADSKRVSPSLGVRLLSDIRDAFGNEDAIGSAELVTRLVELEESPWGDLRGRPLEARGLARRLAEYDVTPTTIRFGTRTPKGYRREDFHDAWQRYLPDLVNCATSATDHTPRPERCPKGCGYMLLPDEVCPECGA